MKRTNKVIIQLLFSVVVLLSASSLLNAQGKYIDKKGEITFEASEELFEPVKATNESVTVILNTETNEIASLALMKGFTDFDIEIPSIVKNKIAKEIIVSLDFKLSQK